MTNLYVIWFLESCKMIVVGFWNSWTNWHNKLVLLEFQNFPLLSNLVSFYHTSLC